MAAILQLVPRAGEGKTVEILRALLLQAEQGQLQGVGLCVRDANGVESLFLTGYFDLNPKEALRACLQASIVLNEMHDKTAGRPLPRAERTG